MRRRDFLLAGAAACCPLTARAQARRRIGVLVAANREPFWSMFVSGLRQVGYVVGENLDVDLRSPSGNLALLPQLAAELVQSKPELIVGVTTPTIEALKHLTADIPIVMAPAGDPVGAGFVKSLARPGGNITGVSSATAEFAGKCVELLREIIPSADRVAVLGNGPDPFSTTFVEHTRAAARQAGLDIETVVLQGPGEITPTLADFARRTVRAIVVQPTLPRAQLARVAVDHGIASACPSAGFAAVGGFLAYSGDFEETYRQAAVLVDKILKGRKAADLPVELPVRYRLEVNLKTARSIGIEVPSSVLGRADEVIE
jgi:putative tryptophan/tyrosine transport system substrate-binding protein